MRLAGMIPSQLAVERQVRRRPVRKSRCHERPRQERRSPDRAGRADVRRGQHGGVADSDDAARWLAPRRTTPAPTPTSRCRTPAPGEVSSRRCPATRPVRLTPHSGATTTATGATGRDRTYGQPQPPTVSSSTARRRRPALPRRPTAPRRCPARRRPRVPLPPRAPRRPRCRYQLTWRSAAGPAVRGHPAPGYHPGTYPVGGYPTAQYQQPGYHPGTQPTNGGGYPGAPTTGAGYAGPYQQYPQNPDGARRGRTGPKVAAGVLGVLLAVGGGVAGAAWMHELDGNNTTTTVADRCRRRAGHRADHRPLVAREHRRRRAAERRVDHDVERDGLRRDHLRRWLHPHQQPRRGDRERLQRRHHAFRRHEPQGQADRYGPEDGSRGLPGART